MMLHKHGLAKVEFWASFETNFIIIAGTLGAETLVSRKTQCLLAIGGDTQTFLDT